MDYPSETAKTRAPNALAWQAWLCLGCGGKLSVPLGDVNPPHLAEEFPFPLDLPNFVCYLPLVGSSGLRQSLSLVP
jgi:hypothetical protein